MIILPNNEYYSKNSEKINTYQFLANVGCPVFDSVLFDENENLTIDKLKRLKEVLKSEYCTVRYQYTKPCINPIRGGNKFLIDLDVLKSKQLVGTQMWLLQPIDRTKNIYGINIYVNRDDQSIIIECVGKGFDVSDINRGDISPHEIIYFNYPIEYGVYNEWWKYISLYLVNYDKFNQDKIIRLNKLKKFGLECNIDIFDNEYVPLDFGLIETLLFHIKLIDEMWKISSKYIVSISMNSDKKLVFWDIQTPTGKIKILHK